jgi:hypothetical protein
MAKPVPRAADFAIPPLASWTSFAAPWRSHERGFSAAAFRRAMALEIRALPMRGIIGFQEEGFRFEMGKKKDPAFTGSLRFQAGAQERTRTFTLSPALDPESSVSTNSTTWA